MRGKLTRTDCTQADEAGTYWYHSHNMGQYVDGLRGALVVYDPNDPYAAEYDDEEIVSLSDWSVLPLPSRIDFAVAHMLVLLGSTQKPSICHGFYSALRTRLPHRPRPTQFWSTISKKIRTS